MEEACVQGRLKVIDYGKYRPGVQEVFDLREDPEERNNMRAERARVAAPQFRNIEEYRARYPRQRRTGKTRAWTGADEERLERLRGLGYVK